MSVSRYKKRGRRAGAVHLRPHSKTFGQRWHGYMSATATGINLSTQEATQQGADKKADAVLPWECGRCGALWGPFQTYCKTCGPLIEAATEKDYRQWIAAHESRPSRCLAGDCEAVPDEGENFCAFHDELAGRNDDRDAHSWIPKIDVGGAFQWDGFSQLILPVHSTRAVVSTYLREPPKGQWVLEMGIVVEKPNYFHTYFAHRGGGAMLAKGDQLQRLGEALTGGLSIRASARAVGCAVNTARKLHAILRTAGDLLPPGALLCACGKPSTHRGWCSPRFAQSPARQAVMEKLRKPKRECAA